MRIVLIILYLLLAHSAAVFPLPMLTGLALISLSAAILLGGLKQKQFLVWLSFIAIAVISLTLTWYNKAFYMLYVPPVIISLVFFIVFFNTLLPGKEPLVTAIGEKSRGPLTQEMRRYTKGVTILWALTCGLMFMSSILLPIYAPYELWSLFANFLNYIILAMLFFIEFVYRCWRFPDHDHPSFIDYIKIVIDAEVRSYKPNRVDNN